MRRVVALATWTYYMKRTRIVIIEIRHKVIPKVLLKFNFDDRDGEM